MSRSIKKGPYVSPKLLKKISNARNTGREYSISYGYHEPVIETGSGVELNITFTLI